MNRLLQTFPKCEQKQICQENRYQIGSNRVDDKGQSKLKHWDKHKKDNTGYKKEFGMAQVMGKLGLDTVYKLLSLDFIHTQQEVNRFLKQRSNMLQLGSGSNTKNIQRGRLGEGVAETQLVGCSINSRDQ